MVLASPGPLLTPPPSSSPPKTPHRSYSAQTRSQNEEKNPPTLASDGRRRECQNTLSETLAEELLPLRRAWKHRLGARKLARLLFETGAGDRQSGIYPLRWSLRSASRASNSQTGSDPSDQPRSHPGWRCYQGHTGKIGVGTFEKPSPVRG